MFGINFREHPSRYQLYVFFFYEPERAACFEEMLLQHNISYEKEVTVEEKKEVIYYGIKKTEYEKAKHLNYLVSARFRKPFIEDAGLRYVVLIISAVALLLAIAGYFISSS